MFTKGHIIVKRTIKEWGWYSNAKVFTVFVHLLIEANFKDGNWEQQVIKRGELVTSIQELATICGLSIQEVRTCLKILGGAGEVRSRRVGRRSILTICKYDDYQTDQQDDNKIATSLQQDTNKSLTSQQPSIIEEGNNGNKKKKKKDILYSPEVEELYDMYPSRCPLRNTETGKRTKCKNSLVKLLKERSFEDLKRNMQKYLDDTFNKHYLKDFQTFLNNYPDYPADELFPEQEGSEDWIDGRRPQSV